MDDLRPANRFDIAATAALLAEPARVAMLSALMDGQARPATELARLARVSASTGSAHLSALVRGGLLHVERLGRHRYHRLAGETAARVFESLSLLAPQPRVPSEAHHDSTGFRQARTCYRHLAGVLGVALVDAFLAHRLMARTQGAFRLTPAGRRTTERLGLLEGELGGLGGTPCLDWTERRDHVAGPLGVALTKGLLERRWLRTRPGTRALRVTVEGAHGLREAFGVVAEVG